MTFDGTGRTFTDRCSDRVSSVVRTARTQVERSEDFLFAYGVSKRELLADGVAQLGRLNLEELASADRSFSFIKPVFCVMRAKLAPLAYHGVYAIVAK